MEAQIGSNLLAPVVSEFDNMTGLLTKFQEFRVSRPNLLAEVTRDANVVRSETRDGVGRHYQ